MYKVLLSMAEPSLETAFRRALSSAEFTLTTLAPLNHDLGESEPDMAFMDLSAASMPSKAMAHETVQSLMRGGGCPVVVVLNEAQEGEAVGLVGQGAYDYMLIPLSAERISVMASRALTYAQRMREISNIRFLARREMDDIRAIGGSPAILQARKLIEQAALSEGHVIIEGEQGTGKHHMASTIHYLGRRQDRNFERLSCDLMPVGLVESEIFGLNEHGPEGGPGHLHRGKLKEAEGGTLYLEDMETLQPRLQRKLLKYLMAPAQGPGGKPRIIASSTIDMHSVIADGRFSGELYELLGSFRLRLPPLRERRHDIPFLLSALMDREARRLGKDSPRPDSEALACLMAYDWPGNMSELKALAASLSLLDSRLMFTPEALPGSMRSEAKSETAAGGQDLMRCMGSLSLTGKGMDMPGLIETMERALIEKAMKSAVGVKKEAARLLGLKRTTLIEKMKKKGM